MGARCEGVDSPSAIRTAVSIKPCQKKMIGIKPRDLVILALLLVGFHDETVFVPLVQAVRLIPGNAENILSRSRSHRRLQADILLNHTSYSSQERHLIDLPFPDSPDEHLVHSLPLLPPGTFTTQHWAGHLHASTENDKYLFYWLFEPDFSLDPSKSLDDSIPLIIWLNGGPGCSSMDGLFLENGPFRLQLQSTDLTYTMVTTEYSWHKIPAYVLYIDQPVGTGLSFTLNSNYPGTDEGYCIDFYLFLQNFFTLHADKFVDSEKHQVRRPVFFATESYGGRYVPNMMDYILRQNDQLQNGAIRIPLAGSAIGNGWSDPFHQYGGAEAAYGHGLIGLDQLHTFLDREKSCQDALTSGKTYVGQCMALIDDILGQSQGSGGSYQVSGYDVRLWEGMGDRSFPPGHKQLESYLGGWPLPDNTGFMSSGITDEVLKAIHAVASKGAGQRFLECTDPPYDALIALDGVAVTPQIVRILDHPDNVQMLFFNGILDLICNHAGQDKMFNNLPWQHAPDWANAKRYSWLAESQLSGGVSGYMKEYKNLKFLKLLDAGHMVPMDLPSVSMDMMRTLVFKGSFLTHGQDLGQKQAAGPNCPTCPQCPAPGPAANNAPQSHQQSESSSKTENTNIVTPSRIVAVIALALLVAFVTIYMSSRATERSVVPRYDLELEATYRDKPDGSGNNTNGATNI